MSDKTMLSQMRALYHDMEFRSALGAGFSERGKKVFGYLMHREIRAEASTPPQETE
jgi:hypothetical protein